MTGKPCQQPVGLILALASVKPGTAVEQNETRLTLEQTVIYDDFKKLICSGSFLHSVGSDGRFSELFQKRHQ